ncbi:Ubiquitin carboxyl-terminal hydrolase 33 [Frankliniella fusca]|uniref:Ubiquitin carboxyl-terminal hydrolase 33 n=1 Tax=Frankliniella fusca TaxID=407009 RepID=A0AAE1L864_9NEOP|nr:Ubiquitin carboxyl-terminal hydrolase 33 [Frankliniella fusca]
MRGGDTVAILREIQHHGKSIPMEYHDVPCTMESPMVFWDWVNRRRVGEMQFMLQKDYTKSKNNPPQEDSEAMKTLAPFELALMRTLQRVKISGGKRERKFAKECGPSEPHLLTGTKLRKLVATTIQLLNLRENELAPFATFMGHDIRIHTEFYRLSSDTMKLAEVEDGVEDIDDDVVDDPKLQEDRDQHLQDSDSSSDSSAGSDFQQKKKENGSVRQRAVKEEEKTQGSVSQKRTRFSNEDSSKIVTFFARNIKNKIVPNKQDVEIFF